MQSVLVDAYNLSLQEGTGVASYARDLCQAIRMAGFKVDLLYETRTNLKDPEIIKNIDLLDPIKQRSLEKKVDKIIQFLKPSDHLIAHKLYQNELVINKGLSNSIPEHDRIFIVKKGFETPIKLFEVYKRGTDIEFMDDPPTISHWTYPLPIRGKKTFNLYTIHDLIPLILPYTTGDNKKSYLKLISWISQTADAIVTVSETSKKDIVRLLNVSENKIFVTYQSAGNLGKGIEFDPSYISNFINGFLNLEYKKYFLFYSAIEPKKNIARLIDAYLQSGISFPLVIIGKNGFRSDDELRFFEYLSKNNQGKFDVAAGSGRIIRIPYLNRKSLAMLVSGATAVTFPSLYEGFGLPIVEAMQVGTAVITSNSGATREIASNATYFVDPYDISSIASGFRNLASDEAMRNYFEKIGLDRAAFFSIENYVERLRKLYASII